MAEEERGGRPPLEMADVIRTYGDAYRRQRGAQLSVQQDRALRELVLCRTAALGGHVDKCADCGQRRPSYNSCRNRHCPKCQARAREAWCRHRQAETLPVEYFHVVLTLPDELAQLAEHNAPVIYDLLCRTAGRAILAVGRQELGGLMGLAMILHSWGQLLNLHPHVHCIVAGGALSDDYRTWHALPEGKFLNIDTLMEEFRRRYLRAVRLAYAKGKLVLREKIAAPEAFAEFCDKLERKSWIVYAGSVTAAHQKHDPAPPAERVVQYLARYAGGTPMGNGRLVSLENGNVTFWYKDYRDRGARKLKVLPGEEFLRRWLQHVLPQQMPHIRHYGFLARNKRKTLLAALRELLPQPAKVDDEGVEAGEIPEEDEAPWERPELRCAHCQGRMAVVGEVPRPTVAEILRMPLHGGLPRPTNTPPSTITPPPTTPLLPGFLESMGFP